jgi:hypothetical protein
MTQKSPQEAQERLLETFEQNSSELFWLAYLMTGNEERGVEAFTRALETEPETPENATFNGFLAKWARKLVIVEALGTMQTELRQSIARVAQAVQVRPSTATWKRRPTIAKQEFEDAVIAIDAFPRCAMLLTIFEGFTMKAAALLLNADEALTGVAQQIGIVQLTSNLAGNSGRDAFPQGHSPVPALSPS